MRHRQYYYVSVMCVSRRSDGVVGFHTLYRGDPFDDKDWSAPDTQVRHMAQVLIDQVLGEPGREVISISHSIVMR